MSPHSIGETERLRCGTLVQEIAPVSAGFSLSVSHGVHQEILRGGIRVNLTDAIFLLCEAIATVFTRSPLRALCTFPADLPRTSDGGPRADTSMQPLKKSIPVCPNKSIIAAHGDTTTAVTSLFWSLVVPSHPHTLVEQRCAAETASHVVYCFNFYMCMYVF